MVNYRRSLTKSQHKNILRKYKKHRDAEGGIFTSNKRRRFLGIKAKSGKEFKEEGAIQFWYDVRTTVRNGLVDLQLICEVAPPDELKKMFEIVTHEDLREEPHRASLDLVLEALLFGLPLEFEEAQKLKSKKSNSFRAKPNEDDFWKAELSYYVAKRCMDYFRENGYITSKHGRNLVRELDDMLQNELVRTPHVPKSRRTLRYQKDLIE
ncbi:MAG: hypothetical protein ACRD38_08675 [Nitrososphaerales archaeon]